MRLRAATYGDAEDIARVHVLSWQHAYRGILPDELLDSLTIHERTKQRKDALMTPLNESVRNWVAERDAEIVGWAGTAISRDEDLDDRVHELLAIYLLPSEIGKGTGRRLMQHCIDDALVRGFEEMTMWVLVGNERAQRFYAAAGFVPDSRVQPREFRDTGVNALRMRRSLR